MPLDDNSNINITGVFWSFCYAQGIKQIEMCVQVHIFVFVPFFVNLNKAPFMEQKELRERLHNIINNTTNEMLLEDLLAEAEYRTASAQLHDKEGLIKEDYDELIALANEPAEKDTISYEEFKQSVCKWFIK